MLLRGISREQGRGRLPFQERRPFHWWSAWAQHLWRPPVATANKLSFRVGATRSLTPPPGPRQQRPGAPRAPHLIPLNPQPGLSQSATQRRSRSPGGFPDEGLGLPAEEQESVGKGQEAAQSLFQLQLSTLPTAQPLPSRSLRGAYPALSDSPTRSLGRELPKAGGSRAHPAYLQP